jgi:hypothetical protein
MISNTNPSPTDSKTPAESEPHTSPVNDVSVVSVEEQRLDSLIFAIDRILKPAPRPRGGA